MTAAQALAAAVNALFVAAGFPVIGGADPTPGADDVVRVFDGQVPGVAPRRFVLATQSLPKVSSRSEGRSRLAHSCRVLLTVTAEAADRVRLIAQDMVDALEGARPQAPGWSVTAIEHTNTLPPTEDRDVQPAGGRYPMFAKLEFEFTATLV